MSAFRWLLVVARRDHTQKTIDFLKNHGAGTIFGMLCHGAAKRNTLDMLGLEAKEKAVVDMRAMQERYKALSSQSGSIAAMLAKRDKGFSLFSFLEQSAADSAVDVFVIPTNEEWMIARHTQALLGL